MMDSSSITYFVSSLIYLLVIYLFIRFVFFKGNNSTVWFYASVSGVFFSFLLLGYSFFYHQTWIIKSFAIVINISTIYFWLQSVDKKYRANIHKINDLLEHTGRDLLSDASLDIDENEISDTLLKLTVKNVVDLKESISMELKKYFVLIEAIERDTKDIQLMTSNMNTSLLSQNTSFTETSTTMKELGVTSEQTTDKARVVVDTAERSLELSQVGMHSVSESTENMKKIRKDVENIANEIKLLKERINDITDIVIKVNNISKKTNLLALNASIEASKAGSAGKGFAVVAVEIRKLAEQAQTSVADIEVIIGKINSSAEKTVYVTEKGVRQVDEGVAQIQETGEIVKESMKSMEQNVISAQQILAASRQQSIGIDQIADSIGQLNKGMNSIMSSSDEIKKLSNSILDISHKN